MEWFKFYHSKWLSDLAVISLDPIDRLCFVTLLCIASSRDERTGTVTQYHEHRILTLTHLTPDDYSRGVGFTRRLIEVGVLEQIDDTTVNIINFEKRQTSNLSGAERAKKYRTKHKVTPVTHKSDESNARVDKIRVDKKRESKPSASINYLKNTPEEDIKEFTSKFNVTEKGVKDKASDLLDWCEMNKGKKTAHKSNYKSFLRIALKKDFGERAPNEKGRTTLRPKLKSDGTPEMKDGAVVMI